MRSLVLALFLLSAVLAAPARAEEKLNLNTATKEQLVALGLTESQALQVISHRDKSGPLLQVEELLAVPQMKKDTFEKVRGRVTVDE
jgi:competence ComEA-like helix-hairpin-helix protein